MLPYSVLLSALLAATPPSAADLRQGILDREAAIHGFRLSCHVDTILQINGKTRNLEASEDIDISTDARGRIRYQSSGNVTDNGRAAFEKTLSAFNGTQSRSMRTAGGPNFRIGEVIGSRSRLYCRLDPWEFVTCFLEGPISQCMSNMKVEVVGTDTWDNRLAYIVDLIPPPRAGAKDRRKGRLWVDPSRASTIIRRAILAQRFEGDKWHEYYRVECFDHKEFQPGLWLPTRVELITSNALDDSIALGAVLFSYKVRISKWELNPTFGDSEFTFPFSDLVNVTDYSANTHYQVRSVNDQSIVDQLAMSGVNKGPLSGSGRRMLVWGNVVVVVAIAAALIFRRMKASK
jgi:hypothetical protein